MIGRVMLAGLFGVVFSVIAVAVRDMRVVVGFFVLPGFVLRGCRLMMLGGVLVMLGRFAMVFGCVLGHGKLSLETDDPAVRLGTETSLLADCDGPMAGR